MTQALDRAILSAHDADDRPALIAHYTRAADLNTDPDAHAYFLTIAYVYALETGDPAANRLYARLRQLGRET